VIKFVRDLGGDQRSQLTLMKPQPSPVFVRCERSMVIMHKIDVPLKYKSDDGNNAVFLLSLLISLIDILEINVNCRF
jgi:hypothetical protein